MKSDENSTDKRTVQSSDPPTETGGLVERLLNAAGPGPEVPEDGAARVKDLIRPVWRDQVAVRSLQRARLWFGGIAAAAALIIAAIYLPTLRPGAPEPGPQTIVIALIDGAVEVTPPGLRVGLFTADDVGAEIPRGSLIRTHSGGRVALWLADHRSLRLDVDTEARLDSEASISLESGAVYVDSADDAASGVEVRTLLGTVTDIGTQFEVRLEDQTLDVKVREGLVALNRGDEEYQITQGVTLAVDAVGAVSTGKITAFDPVWSWTQEIAPAFAIEGRSALAFLDWVSSETGLSIGFANAEVERLAATTILHGSIEGLSPREAPAAVLPSCRLAATEEPGTLLVRGIEADEDGDRRGTSSQSRDLQSTGGPQR